MILLLVLFNHQYFVLYFEKMCYFSSTFNCLYINRYPIHFKLIESRNFDQLDTKIRTDLVVETEQISLPNDLFPLALISQIFFTADEDIPQKSISDVINLIVMEQATRQWSGYSSTFSCGKSI